MPNAKRTGTLPAPERRPVLRDRKLPEDVAAEVEARVAAGRVERIANGTWPNAWRPEVMLWKRRSERKADTKMES